MLLTILLKYYRHIPLLHISTYSEPEQSNDIIVENVNIIDTGFHMSIIPLVDISNFCEVQKVQMLYIKFTEQ